MAKRMSADAADPKHNGADPDTILRHKSIIAQALIQQAQANSLVQTAYKRAKADGCPVEAMKLERKLQKMDTDELNKLYVDAVRVAEFSGRPLGFQALMFGAASGDKPTESAASAYAISEAEQAGYTDATQSAPVDNNPHAPGTPMAAAWSKGWHAGRDFMERSGKLNEQVVAGEGRKRRGGRRNAEGETIQ